MSTGSNLATCIPSLPACPSGEPFSQQEPPNSSTSIAIAELHQGGSDGSSAGESSILSLDNDEEPDTTFDLQEFDMGTASLGVDEQGHINADEARLNTTLVFPCEC